MFCVPAVAAKSDGCNPTPELPRGTAATLAFRPGKLPLVELIVAGAPKNGVQFMVKDSKKYASTGGWGFAHFDNGKPADDAVLKTCFPCHQAVKDRDLVFTRYAP